MDYKTALAAMYNDGVSMLWKTVRATPEEKLDWKPAETSRTARELLNELITSTKGSAAMLVELKAPSGDMDWSGDTTLSVDEMEKAHQASSDAFLAAVSAFPEDKWHEVLELPWGTMSFFDIASYPYWNLMYHYGQIAYIQTLYGDKDMH